MDWLKEKLKDYSFWVWIVGAVVSIIVYFTPDSIDAIVYQMREPVLALIALILALFGIAKKDSK